MIEFMASAAAGVYIGFEGIRPRRLELASNLDEPAGLRILDSRERRHGIIGDRLARRAPNEVAIHLGDRILEEACTQDTKIFCPVRAHLKIAATSGIGFRK